MATGYLIEIKVNSKGAEQKLRSFNRRLSTTDKVAKKSNSAFSSLGSTMQHVFVASAVYRGMRVLTTMVSDASQAALDYEENLTRIEAISEGTAEKMESLAEATMDVAINSEYSASGISNTALSFTKAGREIEETNYMLKITNDLMTVAGDGSEDMADLLNLSINAFGATAEEAEHYGNVLTRSSMSAHMNLTELGHAMRRTAPFATAFGSDVESTAAMIAELANVGIKAGRGGTALRSMFADLMDPQKDLQKLLNQTLEEGDDLFDLFDKFEDFEGHELSAAFQRRGFVAVEAFRGRGEELRELAESFTVVDNYTEDLADKIREAFSKRIEMMFSRAETAGVAMFTAWQESSEDSISVIDELSESFADLHEWVTESPEDFEGVFNAINKSIEASVTSGKILVEGIRTTYEMSHAIAESWKTVFHFMDKAFNIADSPVSDDSYLDLIHETLKYATEGYRRVAASMQAITGDSSAWDALTDLDSSQLEEADKILEAISKGHGGEGIKEIQDALSGINEEIAKGGTSFISSEADFARAFQLEGKDAGKNFADEFSYALSDGLRSHLRDRGIDRDDIFAIQGLEHGFKGSETEIIKILKTLGSNYHRYIPELQGAFESANKSLDSHADHWSNLGDVQNRVGRAFGDQDIDGKTFIHGYLQWAKSLNKEVEKGGRINVRWLQDYVRAIQEVQVEVEELGGEPDPADPGVSNLTGSGSGSGSGLDSAIKYSIGVGKITEEMEKSSELLSILKEQHVRTLGELVDREDVTAETVSELIQKRGMKIWEMTEEHKEQQRKQVRNYFDTLDAYKDQYSVISSMKDVRLQVAERTKELLTLAEEAGSDEHELAELTAKGAEIQKEITKNIIETTEEDFKDYLEPTHTDASAMVRLFGFGTDSVTMREFREQGEEALQAYREEVNNLLRNPSAKQSEIDEALNKEESFIQFFRQEELEMLKERVEFAVGYAEKGFSALETVNDRRWQATVERHEEEMAMQREKFDNAIKLAGDNSKRQLLIEQDQKRAEERLEAKHAKLQDKYAKRQLALSLAQAKAQAILAGIDAAASFKGGPLSKLAVAASVTSSLMGMASQISEYKSSTSSSRSPAGTTPETYSSSPQGDTYVTVERAVGEEEEAREIFQRVAEEEMRWK